MGSQILLVEDEPGLVLTLTDLLASEGYQADTASDGPSGLEKAAGGSYRLIILDVMLPGKSGLEVCRELRQQGLDTAILMLTARTQVHDRVAGLRNGADDYLTKPFHPSELLARVDALMRRVHKEKLLPVHRFEFGAIEVDFERSQVRKGRTPSASRARSCSCCATSSTAAVKSSLAMSCSETSGNTSPASPPAPSMST